MFPLFFVKKKANRSLAQWTRGCDRPKEVSSNENAHTFTLKLNEVNLRKAHVSPSLEMGGRSYQHRRSDNFCECLPQPAQTRP